MCVCVCFFIILASQTCAQTISEPRFNLFGKIISWNYDINIIKNKLSVFDEDAHSGSEDKPNRRQAFSIRNAARFADEMFDEVIKTALVFKRV